MLYSTLWAFRMGRVKRCVNNCQAGRCIWYKNFKCSRYICHHCEKIIEKGNEAVVVSFFMTRVSQGFKKLARIRFHRECYEEQLRLWLDTTFLRIPVRAIKPRKVKEMTKVKRIRKSWGRPKKSTDPVLVNKLRMQLKYHNDLGHLDKVLVIENKLSLLMLNGNQDPDQNQDLPIVYSTGIPMDGKIK